MSWTEPFELDGVTIGGTEISILSGTSSLQTNTDKGVYELWIDGVAAMVKGDRFIWRVYEKVEATGGTKRVLLSGTIAGAQAEPTVVIPVPLGFGWDMTLQKLAGADCAFDASVRRLGSWTQAFELDGVSISTSPISVISGNTTPQSNTTKGYYWLLVDPFNMVKADEFTAAILETVEATGGTQRQVWATRMADVPNENLISPGLMLGNGWDMSLVRDAGSDRAFDASIRVAAA